MNKNNKINAVIQRTKEYEEMLIPQANKLEKIVTVIEVLKHSWINEKDIATGFGMSSRQADYYSNALRFLDIIDTASYGSHKIIGIRADLYDFFSKGSVDKKLKDYIINNKKMDEYKFMLDKEIDKESSTFKRRMQSFTAWGKWVDNE